MSNIISVIFNQAYYNKEQYNNFNEFAGIFKLVDSNNIDIENSFFGYEDDIKKNSFLIQINSKDNIHIPIKIEIDFIYKSCFYTLGKDNPIEQTFGQEDVDLDIVFKTFKDYLSTDYIEIAYYSKEDKFIKGYYISSKEREKKIWYKWSFSIFKKLQKKDYYYKRWI